MSEIRTKRTHAKNCSIYEKYQECDCQGLIDPKLARSSLDCIARYRQLLESYIKEYDDPLKSNLTIKLWLDKTWIPSVREAISESDPNLARRNLNFLALYRELLQDSLVALKIIRNSTDDSDFSYPHLINSIEEVLSESEPK